MPARGWERIYRQQGELKFRVLPKIERATNRFKAKNYEKILDLGCGTGRHSIFLARKGFLVYATDISQTGLTIAREKAKSLNLDNIHFQQHDMRNIPYRDSFFDAVLCIWTIYHGTLDEIRKTVGEIYRVLTLNGTFITDFLSIDDSTYGSGREIERNTFIGDKKTEEDVPHHYFNREELMQLFAEFGQLKIMASSNSYTDEWGQRYNRKYYNIEAVK